MIRLIEGAGCVAVLCLAVASGCSLSIPATITQTDLPQLKDDDLSRALASCVNRLNDESRNAKRASRNSDAIAILGASVSASSGVTSAILAASASTSGDRGEKIGAATTAGVSAVGAVLAVIAKIAESPAVPLARRATAESAYLKGRVALASMGYGNTPDPISRTLAVTYFLNCAVAADPGDFGGLNPQDRPPPPPNAVPLPVH